MQKLLTINFPILFFAIFIFFASFQLSKSEWSKVSSLPVDWITSVAMHNDTLYVSAYSQNIYKSTDEGFSWESLQVSNDFANIYSLEIIDDMIFVGTSANGIFISSDNGLTWQNSAFNLPEVNGFVKHNGKIYASTNGEGIYSLNKETMQWSAVNQKLHAFGIEALLSTPNALFAAGGANGVYSKFDTERNEWNYHFYSGDILAGLMINKLYAQDNKLFAINGIRVYISTNDGVTWQRDLANMKTGTDRLLCQHNDKNILFTNVVPNGTWIQSRPKNAELGTAWVDNHYIADSYSYDVLEFNNKLFLATLNGLYISDSPSGIEIPDTAETELSVFPNPSNGKSINLKSNTKMLSVTIMNTLAQELDSYTINALNYELKAQLGKGMYVLKIELENKKTIYKKIAVE